MGNETPGNTPWINIPAQNTRVAVVNFPEALTGGTTTNVELLTALQAIVSVITNLPHVVAVTNFPRSSGGEVTNDDILRELQELSEIQKKMLEVLTQFLKQQSNGVTATVRSSR